MKSRTRLQWDLFLDARVKTLFVLFFLNVQNKFNLLSSVMVQLHKRNKRKSSSQKNVHLSSLLSPWWTALVSLRESFSSYPEEPLTYNVFVYWLFKKKKKREEKKKLQAPSRFLNIVQPTNWILRHSSVAFFKNLSCNETFFVLRLTWEHPLFVFFLLFVCLLFKLQNTIVRRWDIFKCEIQWSRSTM